MPKMTLNVPEIETSYTVRLPEGMRMNGAVKAKWEESPEDKSMYVFEDKDEAREFALIIALQNHRHNGNGHTGRKGARKTAKE